MDSNSLSGAGVAGVSDKPSLPWWLVLKNEPRLLWNFIRYDLSTTILPNLLFLAVAWKSTGGTVEHLVSSFGRGALYFLLYVVTFCISNQLNGIEEDKLNKPDRPLVRGEVTEQGAWKRWVLYMALFTAVGAVLGYLASAFLLILGCTLLWQVVTYLHNFKGWARHWFTKDLCMGLGIVAALVPAWALVAPMTPASWRWVLTLATSVFLLAPTQDLRDMEGDRSIHRKTLPLAMGEQPTRVFLSVGFVLLAFTTHALLMAPAWGWWGAMVCDAALALTCVLIAWRLVMRRTPRADHQTYMLFTAWYCIAIVSAGVVL